MQEPLDSPIVEKQEDFNYAGFWIRFAAYLLDSIAIGIFWVLLFTFLFIAYGSNMSPEKVIDSGFYNVFSLLFGIAYFAGFESSSYQGTLGKMAVNVKVTDMEGKRISFWNAVGRYLAKIISALILLIGFIMAGFDKKKQGLHDKMANTLVLKS